MIGRQFVLTLVFSATLWVHCDPQRSVSDEMLVEASRFLWSQQGKDGGWYSEMHGMLRTGEALTPFILFTLLDVPKAIFPGPMERVKKGLSFIRRHVNDQGALGFSDADIIEYPNYSTAYALRVLVRYGDPGDSVLIQSMTSYLIAQQFVEKRGINRGDAAYGSWGFGESNLRYGQVGHVDISHTRRVLQALREARHSDSATFAKAAVFLSRAQKAGSPGYDGGFYFSPVVLDANKAGADSIEGRAVFRSYATATCDGLLALLAVGNTEADDPVQDAVRWLREHPNLNYPEGILPQNPDQWEKVLFYYHLSVRSEVYALVEWKGEWRDEMFRVLRARQLHDGSFSNPYGSPNKEDDPLLATAFVIGTLAR